LLFCLEFTVHLYNSTHSYPACLYQVLKHHFTDKQTGPALLLHSAAATCRSGLTRLAQSRQLAALLQCLATLLLRPQDPSLGTHRTCHALSATRQLAANTCYLHLCDQTSSLKQNRLLRVQLCTLKKPTSVTPVAAAQVVDWCVYSGEQPL
jgi:hypothetical protein